MGVSVWSFGDQANRVAIVILLTQLYAIVNSASKVAVVLKVSTVAINVTFSFVTSWCRILM